MVLLCFNKTSMKSPAIVTVLLTDNKVISKNTGYLLHTISLNTTRNLLFLFKIKQKIY